MNFTDIVIIPGAVISGFLTTAFVFYYVFKQMPLFGNEKVNMLTLLMGDNEDIEGITNFLSEKETKRFYFDAKIILLAHRGLLFLHTLLMVMFLWSVKEGYISHILPAYLIGVVIFIIFWLVSLRKSNYKKDQGDGS